MGVLHCNPDDPTSLDTWTLPLTPERVRTIDRTGGTILHTSRTNPSNVKPDEVPDFVRAEDRTPNAKGTTDCTPHCLRVLGFMGVHAIIPIGGDDTLSYATRLHQEGVQIVAIPKTMDNDVFGTDYCIGFSTAVTPSVEAITAFRTSVGSHERIGIVELFGRNSGETSLFAAYLADVDRAVISEVPFDLDRLIGFLQEERARNPSNYAACAYLELSEPDLPTAAAQLVSQGVSRIRVLPLFFGMGKHAREDLPVLVEQLSRTHPDVRFERLATAGEDPRLTALLAQIALEPAP